MLSTIHVARPVHYQDRYCFVDALGLHLFDIGEMPFAVESTSFLISLYDADPKAVLGK